MKIILFAKSENRKFKVNTFEEHHILPKAKSLFPLWNLRKSNRVLLYPKEHIICHKLLAKIYGKGMWDAYWYLAIDKKDGHELSPEEYEEVRIRHMKRVSENNLVFKPGWKKGQKPWNTGKKMSEEFKQKISNAVSGEKNPFYGKTHSKESKEKIR